MRIAMQRACSLSAAIILGLFATPSLAQTYSRTQEIRYFDDIGRWTLGQQKSKTNVNTGLVESSIDYDAASRPWKFYAFGQLLQVITYNADGTINSLRDGKGNPTTLSGWRRGVPQSIQYADGTSKTASVDDSGWIRSYRDESGATTNYDYDLMGRVSVIDYPDGDNVDWNATTVSFVQVQGDEFGIAAGHWRQIVSTGNARKETYYDALLRPLITREYDAANVAGTQRIRAYQYDHEGRQAFASYPVSTGSNWASITQGVRETFDALGRPLLVVQDSELGALTTRTDYPSGRTSRVTNQRNEVTTTSFLAYGESSFEWPLRVEHPAGAITDVSRDVFGKPTAITRRNVSGSTTSTRTFVYDSVQKICRSDELETGTTFVGFDEAGNLAWTAGGYRGASPGCASASSVQARRVDRTYDSRNRLATVSSTPGNTNQVWKYWPDGAVKQITTLDSGVPTYNSYSYNKRRLLIGEGVSRADGESLGLIYGYNPNGHLTTMKYPSGQTVSYEPMLSVNPAERAHTPLA